MTSLAQPNNQPQIIEIPEEELEAEVVEPISTEDEFSEVETPTSAEPEQTETEATPSSEAQTNTTSPRTSPTPTGTVIPVPRPGTAPAPTRAVSPVTRPGATEATAIPRLPENPFNVTGNQIDQVLQYQFNNDIWQGLLGGLPCLDSTQECVRRLQELAVSRSPILREIDARILEANDRIGEAQLNNQRLVNLEVLTPALQTYLSFDPGPSTRIPTTTTTVDPITGRSITVVNPTVTAESPFDKIGRLFTGTGLAELLSVVGIPFVTNLLGGSQAAATRSIAIGDLQIKVAELQRGRAEIAGRIRDRVTLDVLAFDQFKREFQAAQEMAKRERTRMTLYEVTYRFGAGNTDQYLTRMQQMDGYTTTAFKAWAALRKNLEQIKIMTTGDSDLNPDAQLRQDEEEFL